MNHLNTLKQTGIALAVAQAVAINVSSAATITVNNGRDAGVGCTFREAVAVVNAGTNQSNGCAINTNTDPLGTNDAIQFGVTGSTVSLTAGEILINSDLSINPDGGAVTITGIQTDRLLNIQSAAVSINSVTLTNGRGAVFGYSCTLTINNSTISGNTAGFGGALSAFNSSVTLSNSTISSNTALLLGGGIDVSSSSLVLTNSTISDNFSDSDGGISAYSSTLTITNSTISGNTALGECGAIGAGGSIALYNNIIAGNRGLTRYGVSELCLGASVVSQNNLIGDSGQTSDRAFGRVPINGFSLDDNIIATYDGNRPTPLASILAPLADNGGPTQTHALVVGSPAINNGDNSICAAAPVNNLDQRGEVRPVGGNCDIGSFEIDLETILPESDAGFFVVPLPDGKSVIFGL